MRTLLAPLFVLALAFPALADEFRVKAGRVELGREHVVTRKSGAVEKHVIAHADAEGFTPFDPFDDRIESILWSDVATIEPAGPALPRVRVHEAVSPFGGTPGRSVVLAWTPASKTAGCPVSISANVSRSADDTRHAWWIWVSPTNPVLGPMLPAGEATLAAGKTARKKMDAGEGMERGAKVDLAFVTALATQPSAIHLGTTRCEIAASLQAALQALLAEAEGEMAKPFVDPFTE